MSWNKKYRPRSFSQLHLEKARTALLQLLHNPRFPQAFLFSGPKGTGKTSASRILAALLNDPQNKQLVIERLLGTNLPKTKMIPLREPDSAQEIVSRILDGRSLIVHELDAASNRGIDDIRSLKEYVHLSPQEGAVSVFILDEAHMLTNEASNALLKVLEEPPNNVVFILATTERHKILPTIVSRCCVIEFSKATDQELQLALEHILTAENIPYDPIAVSLISKHADGSFRDAVKLLELIASNNPKISLELVAETFGQQQLDQVLVSIIDSVVTKQPAKVSHAFEELRATGILGTVVHKKLLEILHEQLLASLGLRTDQVRWSTAIVQFLLNEYSNVSESQSLHIPLLPLELKSLDLIARAQKKQADPTQLTPKSKSDTQADSTQKASHKSRVQQKNEAAGNGMTLCERWTEFVELVAQVNVTLGAFLRSAQPLGGSLGTAHVRVFYAFHKDQLMHAKSQALLQDMITQLCGGSIEILFEVSSADVRTTQLDTESHSLPALAASALM